MRKPASMKALEELGRVRLSEYFFMREMLYSEIANFHGIPNIPDEIARLVVFLAGPGGAYITGTAIPVAGGNPVGL